MEQTIHAYSTLIKQANNAAELLRLLYFKNITLLYYSFIFIHFWFVFITFSQ